MSSLGLFGGYLMGMLVLYLPGYATLSNIRLSSTWRLVLAPGISICYLTLICLMAARAGVVMTGGLLAGLLVMLGIVMGGIVSGVAHVWGRIQKESARSHVYTSLPVKFTEASRGESSDKSGNSSVRIEWLLIGWGLIVALGVFFVMYISALPSIDSFNTEFDNLSHIRRIKYYLETGIYTPFLGDYYLPSTENQNPFYASGAASFYPSVWHQIGALIASIFHTGAATGEHFANMVFAAGVFPVSMYGWLRQIFHDRYILRALGGVVCMVCVAYPWKLLSWGPLFPNVAAYALVPFVVVSVLMLVRPREEFSRGVAGASFVCGAVALVASQPNAVFSAGVLALFPLGYTIYQVVLETRLTRFARLNTSESELGDFKRRAVKFARGMVLVYALAVLALWVFCYKAGPLQNVVQFNWAAQMGRGDALYALLFAGYTTGGYQIVLSLLIIIGVVRTWYLRTYRSYALTYVLTCLMFVSTAAFNEGFLKHFLTGFWYTDSFRIAALCALAGMPLALLGIDGVIQLLRAGMHAIRVKFQGGVDGRHSCDSKRAVQESYSVSYAVLGALLCVLIIVPFSGDFHQVDRVSWRDGIHRSMNNGFFSEVRSMKDIYSFSNTVLDADEAKFVDKVEDVVGPDEVVANIPDDGSVFAPFVDDLNVYYRDLTGYGNKDEKPESVAIRERLWSVEHDREVQSALCETNIHYVMVLENAQTTPYKYHLWSFWDSERNFRGIRGITDSTPGFELVLQDEDKKLYRITALDEPHAAVS